jgi:2-polyprenyl-3-methyl-5-hydroxy-6-metoxy-1,4-benzoquinol methylase
VDKGTNRVEAINREAKSIRCLLCGGLRHRPIFNEFGIDILQCRECHHVFSSFAANPHYDGFWGEEVEEDDHFYWNEARKRMHQDFFRRFLVRRSGRLLDMGCGLGFFLKAMAPYKQWEAYGCEISPAAVRHARERLGLANVICGPPEKVDLPQSSFDIITLWDVIEHFSHPDPLLRRCHALLREGGICFIRTPNIRVQLLRARLIKRLHIAQPGGTYLQAHDHLHHYSMSSIRRLLERNGFSHVEFVHLHPIRGVSRHGSTFVGGVKDVWFEAVRSVAILSGGHLNLDNLFVVAYRESPIRMIGSSLGPDHRSFVERQS